MKKRYTFRIISFVLTAICFFLLSACVSSGNPWELTVAPTCTTPGEQSRVSIVNPEKIETRTVPALGHICENWSEPSLQTEMSDGVKTGRCTRCNQTVSEVVYYSTGTQGLVFYPIKNNTEYEVADYEGMSSSVFIPAFHNDKPITAIGESAFSNNINLINVSFSKDSRIAYADTWAFYGCKNLKNIELPSSLTNIGYCMFDGCESLENIAIPANVTIIEQSAFNGCYKLKSIVIPAKVTSIGGVAFNTLTSLESVTFEKGSKLQSVGFAAFRGNKKLKKISIPAGVTVLEQEVFNACDNLEEVIFESDNTLKNMGGMMFANCKKIKSIEIPKSITVIGYNAFQWWTVNQAIYFKGIVNQAAADSKFGGSWRDLCDAQIIFGTDANCLHSWGNWTTTTEASCLTESEESRFCELDKSHKQTRVSGVPLGHNFSDWIITSQPDGIADGVKTSSCLRCGENEIRSTSGLEYADNNNSYTIVSKGEADLSGVFRIPSSFNNKPITNIGSRLDGYLIGAFMSSKELKSVIIPKSIKIIETNAFAYCNSLKSIVFEKGSELTYIGEYAFNGCAITDIEIPASITNIGTGAFSGCDKLKNVTFEKKSKLMSIAYHAFARCGSLENIELPDTLQSIGDAAFSSCYSLKEIYIPASVVSFSESYYGGYYYGGVFGGCGLLESIIIDENNEKYSSDGNCVIVKETKTLLIGIKSSIIPDYVISIADNAFYSSQIANIEIPSSVKGIGNHSFAYCLNLTEIIIPETVITIGNDAFRNCQNLTSVRFEAGSKLQIIGRGAFTDCKQISEIIIPSTVISVGGWAFSGWSSTQSIYIGLSQQTADALWLIAWRADCNAKIIYSE